MKIEIVDIVVAVLAAFFLAAFVQLKNTAFLYVVVLLVLAEAVVLLRFRKESEI